MIIDELTNIEFVRKGGQKEMYAASHPELGKVAFKKIITTDLQDLERAKREIRAVQLINSDHVPKIHGHNFDETNPSFLWIVEQYIAGDTLRDRLSRDENFSLKQVVLFLDTMLKLAVQAEQKFLVHRDIKPDNIILDIEGKFWLLDYGISRHLDLESLTHSAQHFGLFTLGYASTEQFRNLKKDIDIRSDLFSVGVVANEMLTGQNFYRRDTNDPLAILRRMEKISIAPIAISGDTQFQLSAFICLIADHRRTRRPRTASEALSIFENVKTTLRI